MSAHNGQQPQQPDRDEEQERREEMQQLSAGMEQASREHERAQSIHESFLNDLLETDLTEPSKDVLRNLISKHFILANYTQEEVHEMKYKLEIRKLMFFDAHPRSESGIVGGTRAYVNDDPTDTLRPLTQEQRLAVIELFDGIWANITRGREMRQQEILQTSISESYVQRGEDEDDSSGLIDRYLS